MDEIQRVVNSAFNKTTHLLLGEEVGNLDDISQYLSSLMTPLKKEKSAISGKSVITAAYYPSKSKLISSDENSTNKKIDINSIKDFDSLIEAVNEVVCYSGNRTFGITNNVSDVDNATNCNYVISGHNLIDVKYGSHICYMRECSYVFGAAGNPESEYLIGCSEGVALKRAVESYSCTNSADLYYCFRCSGSTDCMFSFGLIGAKYVIGNNQLIKEKYLELKKKLISEMANELKSKKKLPILLEIPKQYGFVDKDSENKVPYQKCPDSINKAYAKTCEIMLGKSSRTIEKDAEWLTGINVFDMKRVKGANKPVVRHSQGGFWRLHDSRLLPENEFLEMSAKTKINLKETFEGLLHETAKKIHYTRDLLTMPSSNIVDSPLVYQSNDCYVTISVSSKYVAYTIAVKSDHIFGGLGRVLRSSFALNCYDSTNLSRCFEVDGSHSSADSLFCHNCENVQNGIFCFNIKAKRNQVGNSQVTHEEFMRVRKIATEAVIENVNNDGKEHLFSFPLK